MPSKCSEGQASDLAAAEIEASLSPRNATWCARVCSIIASNQIWNERFYTIDWVYYEHSIRKKKKKTQNPKALRNSKPTHNFSNNFSPWFIECIEYIGTNLEHQCFCRFKQRNEIYSTRKRISSLFTFHVDGAPHKKMEKRTLEYGHTHTHTQRKKKLAKCKKLIK